MEDDFIVQRVHQLMLIKLGCEVDIVDSGISALEKVKNGVQYDIIFVDIGLPDISGFDLIKSLRKIPSLHSIPIVALTGYAGNEEKQACLDAGATDVKHKPIINKTLKAIIKLYAN